MSAKKIEDASKYPRRASLSSSDRLVGIASVGLDFH